MDKRGTETFLGMVGKMTVLDLIGFGQFLGVEEKENFEDYVADLVVAFNELGRKQRREILKYAKKICAANKDYGLISSKE